MGGGSYHSAESVYSTTPADWAVTWRSENIDKPAQNVSVKKKKKKNVTPIVILDIVLGKNKKSDQHILSWTQTKTFFGILNLI